MIESDDDLEFEGQDSTETEYIVDPIHEAKKSIILGLYTQLSALENFYSRLQVSYKKVAITWLVAAFAAMGYLFSQEVKLPIHPIWILIFISFATMFGITLLWFIDVSIYQTYYYGVIAQESQLEIDNKWLPNINCNIGYLEGTGNRKTRTSQSYFYIGCNCILLLIIGTMLLVMVKFQMLLSCIVIGSVISFGYIMYFIMERYEHPRKKKVPIREFFKTHPHNSKK